MRWQWHQWDNMQIICTLLQTDNHASTSPSWTINKEHQGLCNSFMELTITTAIWSQRAHQWTATRQSTAFTSTQIKCREGLTSNGYKFLPAHTQRRRLHVCIEARTHRGIRAVARIAAVKVEADGLWRTRIRSTFIDIDLTQFTYHGKHQQTLHACHHHISQALSQHTLYRPLYRSTSISR